MRTPGSGNARGMLAVAASAIVYGLTPILTRMTYLGGSNAINMSFLRAACALPLLALIMKRRKISFRLSRAELKMMVLAGVLGSFLTTVCLNQSYSFIPGGMATALHFIYPVFVMLAEVLFFGNRFTKAKSVALICTVAGIAFIVETGGGPAGMGVALALISGVTYALKMLFMGKSVIKAAHPMKVAFYLCVVEAMCAGALGLLTGQLTFRLTAQAWLFSVVAALCVSVGALSLFMYGIAAVGVSAAAILSTIEPLTSMVMGAVLFGESMSVGKLIGAACICAGVVCVACFVRDAPGDGLEAQSPPAP